MKNKPQVDLESLAKDPEAMAAFTAKLAAKPSVQDAVAKIMAPVTNGSAKSLTITIGEKSFTRED